MSRKRSFDPDRKQSLCLEVKFSMLTFHLYYDVLVCSQHAFKHCAEKTEYSKEELKLRLWRETLI